MLYDYLIVGQGLAGTIVAYTLEQLGKNISMIDIGQGEACSQVAAGVLNPITGRRQAKTWLADDIFPFLFNFYPQMEVFLGKRFLYPLPIYHPFDSIEQQNEWIAQSATPAWKNYIETQPLPYDYSHVLHQHHLGGWQGKQTGYVDIPALINAWATYMKSKNKIISTKFTHEDLSIKPQEITWKNIKAQKIIFCEGRLAQNNPLFPQLPFNLVKGEVLEIATNEDLDLPSIINKGIFMLPYKPQRLRVGATYKWTNLNIETTTEARQELENKINKLFKPSYQVVAQKAGIRPATKDRRPIVGVHKDYPNVAILNGLGSKGASISPYLAYILTELLEGNDAPYLCLANEINPYRFVK